MRLKFKIDKASFESLAENLKGLYFQTESGDYQLSVDGAVDKTKLDEFRQNNVELLKQAEKYKDIDPEKYQQMVAEHNKIQEKEWIEKGEVDKLVEHRTKTMKETLQSQIEALNSSNATMARQLEILTIDNIVRDNATKLGVAPTAVDDVLLRAKTVYRLEEGKPVPKDSQGNTVYGKDGFSPMPIGEWVGGLKETAPHLFQVSQGSGALGNRGPAGPGTANLSPQQKIASGLQSSGILEGN